MINILGIETSCDDTAVSVVRDGTSILSNVIAAQTEMHEKYGGFGSSGYGHSGSERLFVSL